MVYSIIFKKKFKTRFERVLLYLEGEFGLVVSQKFAQQIAQKFATLQQQPRTGRRSETVPGVRSIPAGKQNRIYYRIEGYKIVVLNMYDTRIDPRKNKLK